MIGPYSPQQRLSDLPEDQTRPAKLLQGVFLIEVGWILGAGFWIGLWSGVLTPSDPTPLAAIVTLMTHAILLGVTLMIVRASQRRGFWDLIGPWEQAISDFVTTLGWTGAFAITSSVLAVLALGDMPGVTQQNILLWLGLLPVAAAAILVQTAAEEIYFRGYIQSTLAARFSTPLVWMVLPSVFFGLLHWQSGIGTTQAVQTVIVTTAFAIAAADLTARSGTLGAAIALHFVYNAMILLVSRAEGEPISGLALYLLPSEAREATASGPILSLDLLTMLVALGVLWLAARNAIRR